MKRLILLAMHGSGGAGNDATSTNFMNFSPFYPWSADDALQEFINENVIVDKRTENKLFRGLYWKGAIDAGKAILDAGTFDDVKVICTKGDIFTKKGKWFAINTIRDIINSGDDITLVPVGKSMGGFDSLEVCDHFGYKINSRKWRRKIGTVHMPFALLIDPDNTPIPDFHTAKKVPSVVEEVLVIRQENDNLKNNKFPQSLRGQRMARKNGSLRGIEDVVYPMPPITFPDNDPHFAGREVTHWTIDEHVVTYGHPTAGTVQDILKKRFC